MRANGPFEVVIRGHTYIAESVDLTRGTLATVTLERDGAMVLSNRINLDLLDKRRLFADACGSDWQVADDLLSLRATLRDFLAKPREPRRQPEPPSGPIPNGADVLDAIEAFIRTYVALPSEHAFVAVALWAAHTHAVDAAESTPRLAFLSPEPECGKTRALEVLELLVPRPMLAVNATPAALFRKVGDTERRPTVLFDEIDTIFGARAKEHEELRGLLNAGHRRSGVAYRCVGDGANQEVREFAAYAAVALAGIGDLPDTLLSRSIVIAMRRRRADEAVTPFRRRDAEADGHALRDKLATWAAAKSDDLAAIPAMPAGLTDRPADVWEPLLAVADAAGGDWPTRACDAAVALVAERRQKEPSLGIRLLGDIRTIFDKTDVDTLSTATLLEKLNALDEAPWGAIGKPPKPLDARGLARRLSQYQVKSKTLRIGDTTPKGYDLAAFYDVFERYLTRIDRAGAHPTVAEGQHPQHGQQTASESQNGVADDQDVLRSYPQHDGEPQQRTQRKFSHVDAENGGSVADVADVADLRRGEPQHVTTVRGWLDAGLLDNLPSPLDIGDGQPIYNARNFARSALSDARLRAQLGNAHATRSLDSPRMPRR